MKLIFKAAVLMLIALLIVVSTYVIFFTDEDEDNESPTIDTITGNTTGTAGKITTIYVTFSDNIDVTEAILYYKTASEASWSSTSIINGSDDIVIPSNSKENWQYYVTVNDAANNGPIGNPSTDGSSYYTITVSEDEDDEDLAHYVFIEEGTLTSCSSCPYVAEILHDLYDPDDPDFYYVTMVHDENNEAQRRLDDDYNKYGFPTVFIDGGYEVVMGKKDKSLFREKISSAVSREVPRLYLNVDAEWDEGREELTTTVTVENKETETYRGHLRVYITEINSRWSDWDGHPYHFGFLDYAINKPVEIEKNSEGTFSGEWQAGTSGYSNVYSENLFVIAVIFSSESTQKFSDPPENEHPFDAHYADVANATRVVEGDLPPSVGICCPKKGLRYIFGFCNEGRRTLTGETVIIGKIKIKTCLVVDLSIEKVEFTVKGLLREVKETVYEAPYEWTWDKFAFGRYTITVKVYDKDGRIATDSIDVIAFIL